MQVTSKAVDPMSYENDKLVYQLAMNTADSIWPNLKTSHEKYYPAGLLITDKSDTLVKTLELMAEQNVLSVPVITAWSNQFYGVISISDIVGWITRHFGNYNFTTFAEFRAVFNEVKVFQNAIISDVIKGPWYSRISGVLVNHSYSLFHVFEMLARGSHKVCVCDNQNKIQSFITQSMSMDYIRNNISLLSSSVRNRRVHEMNLHQGVPFSVNELERPLVAFNKMVDNNVSGLGVTDTFGVLVDVISARDIRGLKIDSDSIWSLYGTIKEFKKQVRQKFAWTATYGLVKVQNTNTIEECINTMSNNKVHRLFVCDANNRAIKCITIRDLLCNILFRPPSNNIEA